MHGIEVADPYVERMLEGFAFLTGRVHLKMDAEFPRFSQRLLELIYPNYLKPTPAIGIVRFTPSLVHDGAVASFNIPRHTLVRAPPAPGQVTVCDFLTAHALMLLPLAVADAAVEGAATALPVSLVRLPAGKQVRSCLRLRFNSTKGKPIKNVVGLDRISIYISGSAHRASHLLELIGGRLLGATLSWSFDGKETQRWIPPSAISCDGYAEDEALLPYDNQSFSGYRILHEYFACPDRFRFFSINGLRQLTAQIQSNDFFITLLFDQAATALEKLVTADDFVLNCTPIINLFPKRGDLVEISMGKFEHHIIADRARPLDYEVHTVKQIQGYTEANSVERVFRPLLETLGDQPAQHRDGFFSVRRQPRLMSENARRLGSRTGYIGSEVFVQLVDQQDAPFSHNLRRIGPDLLCTNRDLALLVASGGMRDLELLVSAPISGITILSGLTPPVPAVAERDITWRLISHLHLNYLTLTDMSPTEGALAMRELLGLYAPLGRRGIEGQADAVRSMQLTPAVFRMPQRGPIVFGRGVSIKASVDATSFAGQSPWLFGSVLERFLTRHVSINSAIEFELSTLQNGDFAKWPVRLGDRPIA
jgi:type VI secretion system protein ImpG